MTISEKILAAHAGKDRVEPGEIVMVKVDVNLANELSAALAIDEFKKIKGATRILEPSSAIFVPDHFTPNKDITTANLVHRVRAFALEQGARWFHGEALRALPMAGRFTMANMSIEAGAKNGIFHVDEVTREYLGSVGHTGYTEYVSDQDAVYAKEIELDASVIEPQVAFPSLPENVRPVSQAGEVEIDQVVIGTCTNGWIEDMRDAAHVLRGHRVSPRVRCIIVPGSQEIQRQMVKEGLMEIFMDAECIVSTSTCGPCIGGHMGVLGDHERCVSTTNRNFVGRMGARTAEIFLTNPSVAAASAIAGRIASPEDVMNRTPVAVSRSAE
jgi:homoaconitase/3-isopropylmalate dehydratase large subunit